MAPSTYRKLNIRFYKIAQMLPQRREGSLCELFSPDLMLAIRESQSSYFASGNPDADNGLSRKCAPNNYRDRRPRLSVNRYKTCNNLGRLAMRANFARPFPCKQRTVLVEIANPIRASAKMVRREEA